MMRKNVFLFGLMMVIGSSVHAAIYKLLEQDFGLLFFYYLFFGTFSMFLVYYLEKKISAKSDQVGFIFIGSVIAKAVLFFAVFGYFLYGGKSSDSILSIPQKLQFLAPFFLFLIAEVFVVLKSLRM